MEGFRTHSAEHDAPVYNKQRATWLVRDDRDALDAILTAEILWDWIYIDELWVAPQRRGADLGRRLMLCAEDYAKSRNLQGIWLWTQSWQAEGFYRHLGYSEFTRFDDFPRGHSRIGFRKLIAGR